MILLSHRNIYKHMRSVQKVSSHVIWKRHLLKKIQETLYIGQWHFSPLQSRHLGTSHSSPCISSTVQNILQNPLLESPSATLSVFPEFYLWSEISFSKVILFWGKARSCKVPNLGCRGAESPGWFDVLPKNSARDVIHEQAHCHDEAANYQLPIAVAIFIVCISHPWRTLR